MALSSKSTAVAIFMILLSTSALACSMSIEDTEAADGSYPDGSVTITTNDSQGEITQTYTEIPDRIIVGNVTCLEMILYFGLGDRIVGIYYLEDEVWSELQDEFQEVVDRLDPEYVCTGLMTQAVATSLQPDLIIGYMSSFGESNWSIGTTQFWNDQGCNVWSLNSQAGETNVEGMKQDYRDLGEIFQIQDATDKYIEDFDAAAESVSGGSSVKTAIIEYRKDNTSYTNYGDSSFIGDALKHCNGVNAFPDGSSVQKDVLISTTDLQAVIIVAFGDSTPEQCVADMLADENLQHIPAVANGNVIGIGLSQTYGGVQALSVMQSISELLSDAAGADAETPGDDASNGGTMLYAAIIIVIIVVIAIAAYFVYTKKKNQ